MTHRAWRIPADGAHCRNLRAEISRNDPDAAGKDCAAACSGKIPRFIDAEHALDLVYAIECFGVDIDNLFCSPAGYRYGAGNLRLLARVRYAADVIASTLRSGANAESGNRWRKRRLS